MNILIIAPHRDDEIIGCGGTIAKYISEGHNVYVVICTTPDESMFCKELVDNIGEECMRCHRYLKVSETFFLPFLPVTLESIDKFKLTSELLTIINRVHPNIVYIPHYGDLHTDHKVVSDCAMVATRPNGIHKVKEVYAYETLSETEWNYTDQNYAFIPNVWTDITNYLEIKISAMEYYKSQLNQFPHPRSIRALEYLALFRGSNVLVDAAECFRLIRKID